MIIKFQIKSSYLIRIKRVYVEGLRFHVKFYIILKELNFPHYKPELQKEEHVNIKPCLTKIEICVYLNLLSQRLSRV